jgi:hypothetical protein
MVEIRRTKVLYVQRYSPLSGSSDSRQLAAQPGALPDRRHVAAAPLVKAAALRTAAVMTGRPGIGCRETPRPQSIMLWLGHLGINLLVARNAAVQNLVAELGLARQVTA